MPAIPPPPRASEVKLLLVDDEEIVRVALRDILQRQGYQVVTAGDVLQAMTLLGQQNFGVILADQQMPQLTGLEFLTEVKRLQPDAARILVTALLDMDSALQAINKAEIYRCILKPWQRENLLQTIHDALSHHLLTAQRRHQLELAQAQNQQLARRIAELE